MESKLQHVSMTPKDLTFQLLEEITNRFSEDCKVGHGGYGVVYKGLYNGEEIAVKKLHPLLGLDDEQFKNEFSNLMRAQHPNIVRLVGYCYEIRHKLVEHNGGHVLARMEERVLCFEYLQGGSLDNHLYEESCGFDWPTRYKIIKGTCEGLNYLHKGSSAPIYHLDLKPANILLDKNMIPKIGDFGLSRLFVSTKSHTTKNIIGTHPYMPPEFLSKGQISKEYDVFSLGVTIIHIMTGPEGYSKRADVPFQEFIDLVHTNWRQRIEATSNYVEEYCLQVKRCIEIALNCVEYDKSKRPTVGYIIHELNQTEPFIRETLEEEEKGDIVSKPGELDTVIHELSISHNSRSESTHSKRPMIHSGKEVSLGLQTVEEKKDGGHDMDKAILTKVGPWGGNAGWAYNMKVSPHHLESVTIWSADIIDAFAFSYGNLTGKKHNMGPWGGPGGSSYTIQLGPSEYLIEVFGTTGPYICAVADVVKSISFVTNENRYGPFGDGGGTPFQTSTQSNGSIVGFFARAGSFVHAIGVYVSPDRHTTEKQRIQGVEEVDLNLESMQGERENEDDDAPAKLGPWGGNGGMAHDMKVVPHRLESLTICSADIINSLALSYNDHNGRQHTLGPWGGNGGSAYTIRLGPFEHLTGMSGTVGSFGTLRNVITSLTFATNLEHTYGPFGQGGGTQFKVPVERNGGIVGFFGSAGSYLEALGVYIRRYWL